MEMQKVCRTTSQGPEVFAQCASGMKDLTIGDRKFYAKSHITVTKVGKKLQKTSFNCHTNDAPSSGFMPCKIFNRKMKEKVGLEKSITNSH